MISKYYGEKGIDTSLVCENSHGQGNGEFGCYRTGAFATLKRNYLLGPLTLSMCVLVSINA